MRIDKRGFTLIELLVVIAIIGILAGIVLASLGKAKSSGNDAQRISDVRQIQYALELYYGTKGVYPSCLYTGTPSGCTATFSLQGSTAMPSPPPGYTYAALGSGANCSSYHLGITLSSNANSILSGGSDKDATAGTACTNSAADFSGLSAAAEGSPCSATAGTTATETCYDVTPN